MSIKPLPEDVVAQIKSSTVITSLNAVACGLLKNALDAKASKITIGVDYGRGNCSVEDDGCGILPSEFSGDGAGLGKLYYTSKHPQQPDVHGRHGTFLASVAALSLLTITSRHRKHQSYNFLSIHNSQVLARHTPALPEQRLLALNHGTRVTVRDLFGAMPVRVKQRATDAEGPAHSRDWEQLIRHVLALLLSWDRDVSVSVKDTATNDSITLRATDSLAHRRSTRSDKTVNLIPRSTRLLAQASLCDLDDVESWVSVGVSAPRYSVNGCVSMIPVATKRTQFISLGIQPILNDYHSNVLYEEVNKVFANSSFGVVEDADDSSADGRVAKGNGFLGRELKAKKGIDRWPMFYLRIIPDHTQTAMQDVDDTLDDGRHGLPILTDLLRAVFHEFLRKHHFRPHVVRLGMEGRAGRPRSPRLILSTEKSSSVDNPSSVKADTGRPSKKRKIDHDLQPDRETRGTASRASSVTNSHLLQTRSRSDSPFASWSRVKSSTPAPDPESLDKPKLAKNTTASVKPRSDVESIEQAKKAAPQAPPLIGPNGQLLRRPFGDSSVSVKPKQADIVPGRDIQAIEADEPDTFVWENPRSKIKSVVNSRTGFVITPRPASAPNDQTEGTRTDRQPRRTCINATPSGEPSEWAKDLLSGWKNPVFEAVEPAVPRLAELADAPRADPKPASTACGGCHSINVPKPDELRTSNALSRISKQDLANAEVIAQVDRKFILAKVPVSSTPKLDTNENPHLLVLIDQHAADERCRVESMMADYFVLSEEDAKWTARASPLDKPLHFDLAKRERGLLERFQSLFQHWGVFYEVAASEPGKGGGQDNTATRVSIRKLPPSIVERCRSEPRLLADLIRKELWKLDESGGGLSSRTDRGVEEGVESTWASRFHGCPQGILDMVNSRACRSAIMFNDVLSNQDCQDLIKRLVQCAFPFQCAHGRPSMVPIIELSPTNEP